MKMAGWASPHKRRESMGENPPAHGCCEVAFKAERDGNNQDSMIQDAWIIDINP